MVDDVTTRIFDADAAALGIAAAASLEILAVEEIGSSRPARWPTWAGNCRVRRPHGRRKPSASVIKARREANVVMHRANKSVNHGGLSGGQAAEKIPSRLVDTASVGASGTIARERGRRKHAARQQ